MTDVPEEVIRAPALSEARTDYNLPDSICAGITTDKYNKALKVYPRKDYWPLYGFICEFRETIVASDLRPAIFW
jgi:hypothetical protein